MVPWAIKRDSLTKLFQKQEPTGRPSGLKFEGGGRNCFSSTGIRDRPNPYMLNCGADLTS